MKKHTKSILIKKIRLRYNLAFNLLLKEKKIIISIFLLLLATFIFGYLKPVFYKAEILNLIDTLVIKVAGKGFFEICNFIITNNLKTTFLSVALGATIIFPLFSTTLNGYVLGFVSQREVAENGMIVLFKILPHGIFEIPALCISMAFGLRIGINIINKIRLLIHSIFYKKYSRKYKDIKLKKIISESLLVYILIVMPLIIIAGLIESLLIALF